MTRFRLTLFAMSVVAGLSLAGLQLLAQQPDRNESVKQKPLSAAHENQQNRSDLWSCAMHPQIRRAESGECPICAMQLLPIDVHLLHEMHGGLPSMEEMLDVALEHNPAVRAARAKVELARAELEDTRLDVVQEVIEFRETRRQLAGKVEAAETELHSLEQMDENAKGRAELFKSAERKVAYAQEKLTEFDAQLALLLGKDPVMNAAHLDDSQRTLIERELLPKARQLFKLQLKEYQTGKAQLGSLVASHRRIARLEGKLARTPQERSAALKAHQALLEDVAAIAEQRYKTGVASQSEVLTIQLEIDGLKLNKLKGK